MKGLKLIDPVTWGIDSFVSLAMAACGLQPAWSVTDRVIFVYFVVGLAVALLIWYVARMHLFPGSSRDEYVVKSVLFICALTVVWYLAVLAEALVLLSKQAARRFRNDRVRY